MKKKHICMLVSNEVTSDPRVTKEASSLSNLCRVSIVGIRKTSSVPKHEKIGNYTVFRANGLTNNRLKKSKTTLGILKMAMNKLFAFLEMSKIAFSQKADVYHAHDFDMLPFAYVVAKLRGALLVYDSHELWAEQRADFPQWFKKLVMLIEGYVIRRANKTITVNESIARELQKRYRLISLPVILHNFTMIQNEKNLQIHDSDSKKVILYHGGYLKDRGLEELINSVKFLPSYIVIRLRGMGPMEEELRTLAAPYIVSGQIEFCEPVAMMDLVKEASEADIGIIPYKPTCLNNLFSLPNKLSEYMMAGLAVCASNLPEIKKLNDRVHFGELFDPTDPKSIAEAIIRLSSKKEYLRQCRKNAKTWADMEGNWEEESEKLIFLYTNLLGERYEKSLDR